MDDLKQLIGDYDEFVDTLIKGLEDLDIDTEALEIDHIAYRVESMERYVELKEALQEYGELALEELVRDRPIAMFELDEPLECAGFTVRYLELPAPSDHKAYAEGLEHADFIIKGELEDFVAAHPGLHFNLSGLEKESHPEISLKVGDYAAKFCKESIEVQIGKVNGL